jgi:hypothetical protein
MFAQSPTDVIPSTWQAIGTEQTMTTIFFTRRELIILGIFPKGSKFRQSHFIDCTSPNLKRENENFHCQIPQATFEIHMDNSMYPNGSNLASKFRKHHVSRLSHSIRQRKAIATFGPLKRWRES